MANTSNLFACHEIYLSELKLRMSEEQNCTSTAPQRNEHREGSGTSKEAGTQEATSMEPALSVEETMDSVLRRLKEKRQHFNLPETIKVLKKHGCSLRTLSPQAHIGVPGCVHPLSAGTAVHFLSSEVGALMQFPEVTLLIGIAQVQRCTRLFQAVLSIFYSEMHM